MSPIYDMDAINNAPDEAPGRKPGIYRVRVGKVDESTSSNGNPMLNLALVDMATGNLVCFDRLMLKGKPFALSLTKWKLQALGMSLAGPLDPLELVGRGAWVSVVMGQPTPAGKRYLQVDINAEGSRGGYWPDSPERPNVAVDESQATTLFGDKIPAKVDPRSLPPDHPDYVPF